MSLWQYICFLVKRFQLFLDSPLGSHCLHNTQGAKHIIIIAPINQHDRIIKNYKKLYFPFRFSKQVNQLNKCLLTVEMVPTYVILSFQLSILSAENIVPFFIQNCSDRVLKNPQKYWAYVDKRNLLQQKKNKKTEMLILITFVVLMSRRNTQNLANLLSAQKSCMRVEIQKKKKRKRMITNYSNCNN